MAGFFREEGISNEFSHQVCQELCQRAVAEMFQLANILPFIVNRFNPGAFAQHIFIRQALEAVFNFISDSGDKVDTASEEDFVYVIDNNKEFKAIEPTHG